jgi:hypothetical protein
MTEALRDDEMHVDGRLILIIGVYFLAGCWKSKREAKRPVPLACKLLVLRCGVGVFACAFVV